MERAREWGESRDFKTFQLHIVTLNAKFPEGKKERERKLRHRKISISDVYFCTLCRAWRNSREKKREEKGREGGRWSER